MEFYRNINPRDLLRTVSAFALALTIDPGSANAEEGSNQPNVEIRVSCSDRPAYGMIEIGPHAEIYVNATNLSSVKTNLGDGSWLYVGKEYAASQDPYEEARGYRVVGYSSDPDSFTANMDGFINSIRGQDVTADGEFKSIRFNPGDVIGVMFRRGPLTEGLPTTDEIVRQAVSIPDCATPIESNSSIAHKIKK